MLLSFCNTDLYGMNTRMGRLKNIDKFDGSFFGLLAHVADTIDPQSRILLETTSEAIIDAGDKFQTNILSLFQLNTSAT